VAANPWHRVASQACINVTAGAAQRIADVARKAVARGQENRAASESRRPERTVSQLGFRGDAEGDAIPRALLRIG
ncbi:MAG: hypothetical protein ABJB95_08115, partial [Gemmatimonadales bacterium]